MSEEINWWLKYKDILCPLWGVKVDEYESNKPGYKVIHSPRAGGWYSIEESLHFDRKEYDVHIEHFLPEPLHPNEIVKIVLSAHIWRHNHDHWRINKPVPRREGIPVIDSKIIRKAESWPMPDLPERIENFMLCLYDLTQRKLGNKAPFSVMITLLQAASCCYDLNEFNFLFDNSILKNPGYAHKTTDDDIWLTPEGYQFVEKLQRPTVVSDQVFVAMWFDNDQIMDKAREAIENGIKEAGYKPIFIDKKPFNSGIADEIITKIRRSRFVVADFTSDPPEQARANVYYEAGFARGLGREVIHMCRKDRMKKVHSDIRHIKHILWEEGKYEELTKELKYHISATILDGPNNKKSD